MRRSSLLMLVAAVILGLVAVFVARTFILTGNASKVANAVPTVTAVVAAEPIGFGEKLDAAKLKVVQWPAAGIPAGTFQRVADAIGDDTRVALRAIDANELLTIKSLSGKESRLSASQLLGPTMRAVAVPIGEASGGGGFIAPGDRVDVYVTRAAQNEQLPYTDQLMQNVRVLAVGQDSNVGKDKPEVTKTATLEVTPIQAQRVALAQSIGTISLSLRNITDESRVPLETAQVLDLNDGTVTRILTRPSKDNASDQVRSAQAMGNALGSALRNPNGAPGDAARPAGPSIEVFRGTKPTTYSVPAGR